MTTEVYKFVVTVATDSRLSDWTTAIEPTEPNSPSDSFADSNAEDNAHLFCAPAQGWRVFDVQDGASEWPSVQHGNQLQSTG